MRLADHLTVLRAWCARNVCLVGSNPMCSIPALQECEGLWSLRTTDVCDKMLKTPFPIRLPHVYMSVFDWLVKVYEEIVANMTKPLGITIEASTDQAELIYITSVGKQVGLSDVCDTVGEGVVHVYPTKTRDVFPALLAASLSSIPPLESAGHCLSLSRFIHLSHSLSFSRLSCGIQRSRV